MARHTVNPGIAAKPEGVFPRNAPSDPGAPHVRSAAVVVDASHELGAIPRIWSSIGYDEINWTYTPAGKTLLKTFGSLGGGGYLVRAHYVFCSGSGFGIPHWGNGNVYHEDADGNPYYDFTIADATYDAIVGSGNHVLVELAFTPRELVPEAADEIELPLSPTVYSTYEHGAWSYPPNDYAKWGGLIEAHVAHCLERYGADEVDHWLWEAVERAGHLLLEGHRPPVLRALRGNRRRSAQGAAEREGRWADGHRGRGGVPAGIPGLHQ